jgi:hypothetical protein
LLLGVASYSLYDLYLLDTLVEAGVGHTNVRPASTEGGVAPADKSVSVDVFSVHDCRRQEDFDEYVPGLTPVLQSPVVGLWREGKLVEKAVGAAGRKVVAGLFGLDPDEPVRRFDVLLASLRR